MAKLVIYEDAVDGAAIFEDFELITNRILIGSSADNQLILEAPDIDSSHASLELREEFWVLQDLGGPGGTFVNGHLIDGPYQLNENDMIQLGDIRMQFQQDAYWEEETNGHHDPAIIEEMPQRTRRRDTPISGRAWYASMVGLTLGFIFVILFLMIVAHFLGLINIADLVPFVAGMIALGLI